MGESWTKEQFEDHWYSVMPPGTLAETIPCDCEDDRCHGWRMKVLRIPTPPVDLTFMPIPIPGPLRNGESVIFDWTMEV